MSAPILIARLIASSSTHCGHVGGKSVGATRPSAIALFSRYSMTSPFSQWSWVSPPWRPTMSITSQMKSSGHMRPRFL